MDQYAGEMKRKRNALEKTTAGRLQASLPVVPYFLADRAESQSIAASMTPETTKVRWITTNQ